eukprot:94201-Rhodomonas_salina.3
MIASLNKNIASITGSIASINSSITSINGSICFEKGGLPSARVWKSCAPNRSPVAAYASSVPHTA